MANKVFIQDHFDSSKAYSYHLTKDPMFEMDWESTSFSEVVPEFKNILDTAVGFSAGVGGEVGTGMVEFQNLFDIKRWKKSNPVGIAIDIQLFSKTDAEKDVHDKSLFLMNYTMLTKEGNNYIVPGISLSSISEFQSNTGGFSSKAKIISLWIPGMIYLPRAIILRAQPTFSRERTKKGFPLWAELNLQIESINPANSEFFETSNIGTNTETSSILFGALANEI